MTFQTETEARRERKKLEMIRFPPVVQPKTDTKVQYILNSIAKEYVMSSVKESQHAV